MSSHFTVDFQRQPTSPTSSELTVLWWPLCTFDSGKFTRGVQAPTIDRLLQDVTYAAVLFPSEEITASCRRL